MNTYIYLFRRVLYSIPVFLGICFVILILFNILSPEPAYQLLGRRITREQILSVRKELGLDRPLLYQYLDIVKSAVTLDFGSSWSSKQKISQMIKRGIVPSLTVTLPAFILAILVAISLALVVVAFHGRYLDKVSVFICIALMSVPSLAYILFGQYVFAYKLNLFPISGYVESFPYFIPYVLLPVIIWVIISLGPDVRFYRTVFLDEIHQNYVVTARAKGVSPGAILFKHVFRNALIPIITNVVIEIPFLILGSLLLEKFFSIPGIGGLTITAIDTSDFPVIKAMTIITALLYIVFNLITDILYTLVDPRIALK
jgi:peptide/nickel transport system permease protein